MIRLKTRLNAVRRRGGAKGQIATFLLIVMVAVLIFTMMTANLGQVAVNATAAANAADAASLRLASQLSTRGHTLYESLGHRYQRCQKSGFLGIVLSLVFAAIAVFVPPVSTALVGLHGSAIAAGAIAGAVGGAIGGAAIQGNLSGAFTGALQGAALGAAMAYGVSSLGAGHGTAVELVDKADVAELGLAPQATVLDDLGTQLLISYPTAVPMANVAGMAAASALTAGSNFYNESVQQRMREDAIAAFANAMNGLPEHTNLQQAALLEALQRVVDDPNQTNGPNESDRPCEFNDPFTNNPADPIHRVVITGDPDDSDGNGSTANSVPCFEYWFNRRILQVKDQLGTANIPPKIAAFLAAAQTFRNQAEAAYRAGGLLYEGAGGYGISNDGSLVALARVLNGSARVSTVRHPQQPWQQITVASTNTTPYPVFFWTPGPTGNELDAWWESEADCGDDCAPSPANDEMDVTNVDLREFVSSADGILDPESHADTTWATWAPWFYDVNNNDDYYDQLHTTIAGNDTDFKGVQRWRDELQAVKGRLPECACAQPPPYAYAGSQLQPAACPAELPVPAYQQYGWQWQQGRMVVATNTPCRVSAARFAAVTADLSQPDQIETVQSRLTAFINQVEAFRNAAHDQLGALPMNLNTQDQAVYRWRDMRGDHTVRVHVGPFRMPELRRSRSGGFFRKKVCLTLVNHSDSGGRNGRCWVEVSRTDPTDATGSRTGLWRWNATGVTSKMSRARYTVDSVGLGSTEFR